MSLSRPRLQANGLLECLEGLLASSQLSQSVAQMTMCAPIMSVLLDRTRNQITRELRLTALQSDHAELMQGQRLLRQLPKDRFVRRARAGDPAFALGVECVL